MSAKTGKTERVIAISVTDWFRYGCPHCGHLEAQRTLSVSIASRLVCANPDCGRTYCTINDGNNISMINFGTKEEPYYPELLEHPLAGDASDRSSRDEEIALRHYVNCL